VGDFFAQAIPLSVAIGLIACLWHRGVLESWLARIGWTLVLISMATLVMYWLEVGTLHGTGPIFTQHVSGIGGVFQMGLNFVLLYFLIAGPWMVLGCIVVGTVAGVGISLISKRV
jgi:hypothetical protein